MPTENPKYFAAGDAGGELEKDDDKPQTPEKAGGGLEKDNDKPQTPEKKEIKINPNIFDEGKIENMFKNSEVTETTKKEEILPEEQADEETIEEQNKTIASINKHLGIENKGSTEPEKQPEKLPEKEEIGKKEEKEKQAQTEELKKQAEEFLTKEIKKDIPFCKKGATQEEYRTWQEKITNDFKTLPPEKQDILRDILRNKLGDISKQIEEIQNKLQDKTIDDTTKKRLENTLKDLEAGQVIASRLYSYYPASAPEKEPQPTQQPEKPPENAKIKEQLHGLIEKAAVVFYSKEVDPNERIKLMGEYSAQITKLLNIPSTTIYLTELITDNKKQSQFIDKISGVVDKEKQIPKPEAVEKAKEFIKSEEKKGKESIFQKMGGWGTVGGIAGFSLMMFLILIFLGEFKLLEKATGMEIEGGGKGGKK